MTADPWADQIAAAKRDAASATATLQAVLSHTRALTEGVAKWVEAWRATADDLGAACPHVRSPSLLIGLLTEPGTVHCPRCAPDAIQRAIARNPDRCDSCGQTARTFREVVVPAGPVLLLMGHVCRSCYTEVRQVHR